MGVLIPYQALATGCLTPLAWTVVGGPGRAKEAFSGASPLMSAVYRAGQYRRDRRAVTRSAIVAPSIGAELPSEPPGEGRCQMLSTSAATKVLAAVWSVLRQAAVIVPSVWNSLARSGHMKVLPLRRRPLLIWPVCQVMATPTPAAYAVAPPEPVWEITVAPVYAPVIWPVASEITSPAAGVDHVSPFGNRLLTAEKNVARFAPASTAKSL